VASGATDTWPAKSTKAGIARGRGGHPGPGIPQQSELLDSLHGLMDWR